MDYSLQHPEMESYSVSFLPGETTDECQLVFILEDTVLEENEVFSMSLTTGSSVVDLSPDVATVTILDNDGMQVIIGFSEASYIVSESQGSVLVCVVLTGLIDISLNVTVSAEGN